jgi:hypothetical protein
MWPLRPVRPIGGAPAERVRASHFATVHTKARRIRRCGTNRLNLERSVFASASKRLLLLSAMAPIIRAHSRIKKRYDVG